MRDAWKPNKLLLVSMLFPDSWEMISTSLLFLDIEDKSQRSSSFPQTDHSCPSCKSELWIKTRSRGNWESGDRQVEVNIAPEAKKA